MIAVSSAFGWTARLIDLVAGEPAPPSPSSSVRAAQRRLRAAAIPIFRTGTASETIVEQAHGVLGIDSSVGPSLHLGGSDEGRRALLGARRRPRSPSERPPQRRRRLQPVHAGATPRCSRRDGEAAHGRRLLPLLIEGGSSRRSRRSSARYADGRSTSCRSSRVSSCRATGRGEARIARRLGADGERDCAGSRSATRDTAVPRMPEPSGPSACSSTSRRRPAIRSLRDRAGENGTLCQIIRYRGGTGRGCNADPRDRHGPGRAGDPSRPAERGRRRARHSSRSTGAVGTNVASLEVDYEDGTSAAVPIVEQFVISRSHPPITATGASRSSAGITPATRSPRLVGSASPSGGRRAPRCARRSRTSSTPRPSTSGRSRASFGM